MNTRMRRKFGLIKTSLIQEIKKLNPEIQIFPPRPVGIRESAGSA